MSLRGCDLQIRELPNVGLFGCLRRFSIETYMTGPSRSLRAEPSELGVIDENGYGLTLDLDAQAIGRIRVLCLEITGEKL